ncbi:MAG: DUF1836 domain-containing protein [Clostridiales bacterium]|jgi:hypothetical protein|nr:DUF1836 domain-containing protein [Clostridiales bacterium]
MDEDLKLLYDIIETGHIPEINLYMDQITTFMEEKLENHKRNKTDKIITKTMINNYTKDKILPPPIRKKYTPEQLMLLIIIFHIKPVLSMSDIGRIIGSGQQNAMGSRDLYNLFVQIQKSESEHVTDMLKRMHETVHDVIDKGNTDKDKKFEAIAMALYLALDSAYKKSLAEQIIDLYLS